MRDLTRSERFEITILRIIGLIFAVEIIYTFGWASIALIPVGFCYSKLFGFVGGFRVWSVFVLNGILGTIGQIEDIPQLTHDQIIAIEKNNCSVITQGNTVWVFPEQSARPCFKYRGFNCSRNRVTIRELEKAEIPPNNLDHP